MSERETPKITVLPMHDDDPVYVAALIRSALDDLDIRTVVEYWDPVAGQLYSAIS
jgi:hypothetical protein